MTFFTLGLLFIFAFYFYSIFWFPSSHLNDKNPVRFINLEEPLTIKEKILIAIYDFFQNHKKLEKILPFILGAMIYGLWKFIT